MVKEVVVYQPDPKEEKVKQRKGSKAKGNVSGRRLDKDVGVLQAFGPSGR